MSTMRFILNEEVLTEDIAAMRKYYPSIPEEDFIEYIKLDPTYKGGDNAGTYARWILNLASKGEIDLKDDSELGTKVRIKDALAEFERVKKLLVDRDIMKFKGVQELEDYLVSEDSYNDPTHRQIIRQRQKERRNADLVQDADLVFDGDEWQVWIPKTFAASCKLGQGTKWCTASTEDARYYDDYSEKGPLYVIISKSDPSEKYQFHFPTSQFMDADDDSIETDVLMNSNPELKGFFDSVLEKDALEHLKPFAFVDGFYDMPIHKVVVARCLDQSDEVQQIVECINEDADKVSEHLHPRFTFTSEIYDKVSDEAFDLLVKVFVKDRNTSPGDNFPNLERKLQLNVLTNRSEDVEDILDDAYIFGLSHGNAITRIEAVQMSLTDFAPDFVAGWSLDDRDVIYHVDESKFVEAYKRLAFSDLLSNGLLIGLRTTGSVAKSAILYAYDTADFSMPEYEWTDICTDVMNEYIIEKCTDALKGE